MPRPISDASPRKAEEMENMTWDHKRVWRGFNRHFFPTVIKKYPELIPLITIASIPPLLAVFTIRHNLVVNPSVRASNKKDPVGPHEFVGPTTCTKYYNSQPHVYKPIPELEAVKKDLRDAAPEKMAEGPC